MFFFRFFLSCGLGGLVGGLKITLADQMMCRINKRNLNHLLPIPNWKVFTFFCTKMTPFL